MSIRQRRKKLGRGGIDEARLGRGSGGVIMYEDEDEGKDICFCRRER
jgi:hypothetical protein